MSLAAELAATTSWLSAVEQIAARTAASTIPENMPGIVFWAARKFRIWGPTRSRGCPRLRPDIGFVVERACRYDRDLSVGRNAWQRAAAFAAEDNGEAFGFGDLIATRELFSGGPGYFLQLQNDVAGMRGATGFPAALAMTVIKAPGIAPQLIGNGATQAAARQGDIAHLALR